MMPSESLPRHLFANIVTNVFNNKSQDELMIKGNEIKHATWLTIA